MRNSIHRCFAFGCAAALGGSAASAQERPADTAASALIEAVVYQSLPSPSLDIYLYERAGETPRRLTDDPALDYNPVFSPDGRWLVFTSERAGGADLYALDLEGDMALVRLTRDPAFDDAAAFSPDGERLAFVSSRDGDADIFVMPFQPADPGLAEAAAANLTRRPGGDLNPAFSPDGGRIAFSRQDTLWRSNTTPSVAAMSAFPATTYTDVYVMSADGSNPTRLTEPGAMSGSPAWSADGEHIYYYRANDRELYFAGGAARGEGLEIRRVNADGAEDAPFAAFGFSPAAMPNGRIAFVRGRIGTPLGLVPLGDVISRAADGADLRAESDPAYPCQAPAFAGGSERMACHGPGPVETLPLWRRGDYEGFEGADAVFAPPGARRTVELPDRTLVVHGVRGAFPAVLPNGDIVWSSPGYFGSHATPLFVSHIDGSDERPLVTVPSATIWAPAVARDAGWIVFSVGQPVGEASDDVDIWKVRLDGGEAVNLTPDSPVNEAQSSVSADGNRIVFRVMSGAQAREIHMIDSDGGDRRRLDDDDLGPVGAALSPDGKWVVYPIRRTGGGLKLWIQPVDGGEGRLLEPARADIPDRSGHVRFSPDGRWVVFASDRGHLNDEFLMGSSPQSYGDLWAVPVAGGPAVRLTDNKWEDGPSDWAFVRPID